MKKSLVINILVLGLLFTGCDDYLDVNTDPNNPTEVSPDLVLPVGQDFTARWMHNSRRVNHLGNMLMYNWSESYGFSWYEDEFNYRAESSTFYSSVFDEAYERALKQYADLEELDSTYTAYKAIAKIMEAYTFQILVDLYGDIPYFEALQRGANSTPAYTDAEVIYDSLIADLTTSIDMLSEVETSETAVVPGDDDAMFGGDLTQWKQFANTIKLRILTRESDVKDASYISNQLEIISSEGSGYISADVEVNPGYLNEATKQNPLYAAFGADENGNVVSNHNATPATDYIIELLQTTNDPRIDFLYEAPASGHKGVAQINDQTKEEHDPSVLSLIGSGLLVGSTQGSKIMTLAEAYFNQAELALKGFGGDPESLYEAGVTASFESLGASGASTYLAQSMENVSYSASPDKLEAIITQKWLAVNGVTAEQSWFDWVRTGYPSNLPLAEQGASKGRPVRLSYPSSELSTNSKNVPDQPNVFSNTVFWGN